MNARVWITICIVCVAAGFAGALFFTGGISALPGKSDLQSASNKENLTLSFVHPIVPPWSPGLVVSRAGFTQDEEGYRYVNGTITNNGTESYSALSVFVDLMDANAKTIGHSAYAAQQISLSPGGTCDFEILVMEDGVVDFNVSSVYGWNKAP